MISDETHNWIACLSALKDEKETISKFEKAMSNRSEKVVSELRAEIIKSLKEIETKTGYDWSSYLDDFDFCNWEPGEFYETIEEWLLEQIREGVKEGDV